MQKSVPLMALFFAANLAVFYLVSPFVEDALISLIAGLADPQNFKVSLAFLPFHLYSLDPSSVHAVLAFALLNAFIAGLFQGFFASAVRHNDAVKGITQALRKWKDLTLLAFLLVLLFAVFFSFFLASSLILLSSPPGTLTTALEALLAVFLAVLGVELLVHVFAAFPALVFDDLIASEALHKSSSFAKGRTIGIVIVLIVSGLVSVAAGVVEDQLDSLIADDFAFVALSNLVITVAFSYTLLLTVFYYRDSTGKYGIVEKTGSAAKARPRKPEEAPTEKPKRRKWAYARQ